MISVRKITGDERKYCTHCDDRAVYELNYLNPRIVQQSSCGTLCCKCMRLLKAAITKVTSPPKKSSIKQPLEYFESEAFNFYFYYTQKNILPSEKKKLKQKWLKVLKKSGWTKQEYEREILLRTAGPLADMVNRSKERKQGHEKVL